MRRVIYAALSAIILVSWGCSSGNDSTTILDASGKHPAGWVVQTNGGNHPGYYITLPERCVECHGSDLRGGISKVSCFSAAYNGFTCHPNGPGHPVGFAAPEQHGAQSKAAPVGNGGMDFCRNCHGPDYAGVGQIPSCLNCHGAPSPHPRAARWRSAASPPQVPSTHTNTNAGNAPACSQCHNALTPNLTQPYLARFAPAGSFNGIAAGCFNGSLCHAEITRTTNCNVCHGPLTAVPGGVFNNLSGNTLPSNTKVGAHAKHLGSTISTPVACNECHPVPATYTQSGSHRNGTTNMDFGSLATHGSLNTTVTTSPAGAYSCNNVYCHGVTIDINNLDPGIIRTPTWNVPFQPSAAFPKNCGRCHGYPPTTVQSGAGGHINSKSCSNLACHPEVNSTNDGFTASGLALHINGTVNANGGIQHAFPYGGSVHMPGGTGSPLANAAAPYTNCSGCHDTTTTTQGPYPVAFGVPPLCSACHLNMARFTGATPGCWDCHGSSAADGRPNGSSFPNRQGSGDGHNRGTHTRTCTTCHPITTGSTAHGWSNNAPKSTNAQVVTTLNWTPGTRGPGQGTCNPSAGGFTGCHGSRTGWY